ARRRPRVDAASEGTICSHLGGLPLGANHTRMREQQWKLGAHDRPWYGRLFVVWCSLFVANPLASLGSYICSSLGHGRKPAHGGSAMIPKPPPREGSLGFLYLPPFRIQGTSIAGEATCIQVPELDVCFDMGACPRAVLSSRVVAVSHGHMDHIGSLAY